jgi:uncharacterized protein YuzE
MEKSMSQEAARSVFRAVPSLVDIPARKYWVDYDEEADVLYVSFERPQKATDTEETDDGVLLRYRGESLVGVTVLNASTRSKEFQGAA